MQQKLLLKNVVSSMMLSMACLISFGQTVTSNLDDGSPGTLRSQINAATAGATVNIDNSVTNIVLTMGQINLNQNITINGNSAGTSAISGGMNSRIFEISNGSVTINNVALVNGVADNGGAIQIADANLTMNNVTLSNNTANAANGSGGAIMVASNAQLTANTCSFTNNIANRAGGAIEGVAGTTITLNNSTLAANKAGVSPATPAPGNGGGLHITGSATTNINGGTIVGNMAAAEGGGLWNGSGTMNIDGSLIVGNTASGASADNGGGGIYNLNNGTLNITNAQIRSNTANGASGSGGGILNDVGAQLSITNSTIAQNTANRAGGGIEDNSGTSTIMLTNVHLDSNSADGPPGNGGGLHITGGGSATIMGGTVNGNMAASEGGGLWNGTGTMSIDGTMIMNNTASGASADNGGGGIYNLNNGTVTITNAMIKYNIANGTAGSGGGILNDVGSQLSVSNSEIIGNIANRAGGGIEDNSGTSTITLTDINLDSNVVLGPPGNGGGLHITGGGSVTITGGTVNGNEAQQEGGGLWNGSGMMIVNQTEIDGNWTYGNAAHDGGAAIFNNGGDVSITETEITNNMATGTSASGGGLLSLNGEITIESSMFNMNAANRAGGAIEIIKGILTIDRSDFMENDVNGTAGMANPGNGGAIHITDSTMIMISESVFTENTAGREGGALWNQTGSVMTLNHVTVDNNMAFGDGIAFGGGGVFNNGGDLMIMNSTISNNSSEGANGNGGGVHVKNGMVSILTSTISGNSSAHNGGGIYNNAMLSIDAATIAMNSTADSGSGIYNMSTEAVSLKNSIVSNNMGMAEDISTAGSAYTSSGHNIIGMTLSTTITAAMGDMIGDATSPIDARLEMLADNGGQTMTHALMFSSPAYNAGDMADMFEDQRGMAVYEGRRDIGAFEAQSDLLSINEIANSKLSLYPNPSPNGLVNISLDYTSDNINASIIEMATGKVVRVFQLNTQNKALDLSDLASGVYGVRLESSTVSKIEKLVIK